MQESCTTAAALRLAAGRQLKARLVLAGVRVPDLAAAIGTSPDTVYRVLRGARNLSDAERSAVEAVLGSSEAVA